MLGQLVFALMGKRGTYVMPTSPTFPLGTVIPEIESTAQGPPLFANLFLCSDLKLLLAGTGSLGSFAVALGIDLGSEGVLELDSDDVDK